MSSLAGSVADGVQLMPLRFLPTTDTAHQYKEGKGSSKVRKLAQKPLQVNEKKEMLRWLNVSLNEWKQGMSFQLPSTYNPNKSLCQDACLHLMLHPYITALRTSS